MVIQIKAAFAGIFPIKDISNRRRIRHFIIKYASVVGKEQTRILYAVDPVIEQLEVLKIGDMLGMSIELKGRQEYRNGKSHYSNADICYEIIDVNGTRL